MGLPFMRVHIHTRILWMSWSHVQTLHFHLMNMLNFFDIEIPLDPQLCPLVAPCLHYKHTVDACEEWQIRSIALGLRLVYLVSILSLGEGRGGGKRTKTHLATNKVCMLAIYSPRGFLQTRVSQSRWKYVFAWQVEGPSHIWQTSEIFC